LAIHVRELDLEMEHGGIRRHGSMTARFRAVA
jgi:hypothetical protein